MRKKFKGYAVVKVDDSSNIQKYLTVSDSKQNCINYLDSFLRIEHLNHFKQWCELRELKADTISWQTYKQIVIKECPYIIIKIKFFSNFVEYSIRNTLNCVPIGMAYEFKNELINYLNKIYKEDKKVDSK